MRRHSILVSFLLLCAMAASAQVIVVKAGRLVDPDSGTVLTDQTIVIRDHKIAEVGRGLAVPSGAKADRSFLDDRAAGPDRLPYARRRRPGRR